MLVLLVLVLVTPNAYRTKVVLLDNDHFLMAKGTSTAVCSSPRDPENALLFDACFPSQSHQHFPKQKARPHSPLLSTPGEEVFQCTSAITEMDKTSATGCSHHAHMMQSTCGCRDSICCLLGELSFSNRNEKAMARKGHLSRKGHQGLPIHVNAMTALG